MKRVSIGAFALFCAGLHLACAMPYPGAKPADPDWPCDQPYVPKLSAASFWAGAIPARADPHWRDTDAYSALVTRIVSRDTADARAAALARSAITAQPRARRAAAAAALFGAVVEEANFERDDVISHLDSLFLRQQNLSQLISGIEAKIASIPDSATGDQADQRQDLIGQRDLNIQSFQDTQHTIRYACEVPGSFERRLGLIARTLAPP